MVTGVADMMYAAAACVVAFTAGMVLWYVTERNLDLTDLLTCDCGNPDGRGVHHARRCITIDPCQCGRLNVERTRHVQAPGYCQPEREALS